MEIRHNTSVATLSPTDLKPSNQKRFALEQFDKNKLRMEDVAIKHFTKTIVNVTRGCSTIIFRANGETKLIKSNI